MTASSGGAGAVPEVAISARECIFTARAIRRFRDAPVPADSLRRIIEAATMAPSAENRQHWRFVAVTRRDLIESLGALYADVFGHVAALVETYLDPKIFGAVEHLARSFARAPAVVVVGGVDAPPEGSPHVVAATWWASVLPAVQNLILGARAEGLGATLTTLPLVRHDEVRDLLGAPREVTLVAVVPVGFPSGRFGRPPRLAVDEVAFADRWGEPLAAAALAADDRQGRLEGSAE